MSTKWQIWIDMGGTFTDCLAAEPQGAFRRIKVLSNSALRGKIISKIQDGNYQIRHNWPVSRDIFAGYRLSFPAFPQWGEFEVTGLSPAKQEIQLSGDTACISGEPDFELSTREEAPILAARLATQTPLRQPLPPMDMRLGFTKGTNALLEKKGAKTALLITRGFADLPAIGTQQRPHLFELNIPDPFLLYQDVLEVEERLDAAGNTLIPLSLAELQRLIARLQELQPESVAISLLHSYRNPVHEQILGQALREAGFRYVSLSHTLYPAIKLLPRTQTALVNAYLAPLLDDYLQRISAALQEGTNGASSLLIMSSAGGLSPLSAFFPKDSLLSGPAGGAVGARNIALRLGFPKVLTLDMGGTSTDSVRISERYHYRFSTRIDDIEIQSPAIAIESVAAGGGSICSFDGRQLRVGPQSAGASPGPACYGAGGPLTITDVNLLLGKLDSAEMGIPISTHAARNALNQIVREVNATNKTPYSAQEILRGFEAIANEKMAGAIRKISVAQGFDPKEYALLAFGGAGGLHACRIAELLGMRHVIIPFDAGLLSAYGMGQASVQRFIHQQVLKPWDAYRPKLDGRIHDLYFEAKQLLLREGFGEEEIAKPDVLLYLRLESQDSTLEIPLAKQELVEMDFERKYRELFGYYPSGRKLELESIKVIAATRAGDLTPFRIPAKVEYPAPERYASGIDAAAGFPVFRWPALQAGMAVRGPAIVLNSTSSAFIEPGWTMVLTEGLQAVLQRDQETEAIDTAYQEAIDLELFTNRFTAIAEEMGMQLQRTALSVNVKERLDFSCALLDSQGELLVNAPHIPVHLGSLGVCGRLMRHAVPLEPGDIVITNHPKYGGSHLPDVTLMCGVFTPEGTLIGYAINRAHHAEIGGKTPGSMPPDAQTLIEEGVAILPQYLIRKGEPRWDALEKLLRESPYPSRSVEENITDLQAAIAALKAGERGLQALVDQFGLPKVHYYMRRIKESASQELAKALEGREGKKFSATEKLDDGHQIQVALEVRERHLYIDFSGTSAPHPYNLNANLSIVYSAVIYVLRLLCGKEIPLNEGLLRDVSIQLPVSFLAPDFTDDPIFCPAVVGGNTEVSQRLVDTLLKALGLAACSQGTMNNFLFGDHQFGYYETIGGGAGAGPGFHGRSAVHQHMTNTRITDPEEIELRYPARLWRFGIRRGSGGKGKWNGGDGIVREWEFLRPVKMTLLSQHRVVAPYGLEGGEDGHCGRQWYIAPNGARFPLTGIESRTIESGGRIILETPGGGAYGHDG